MNFGSWLYTHTSVIWDRSWHLRRCHFRGGSLQHLPDPMNFSERSTREKTEVTDTIKLCGQRVKHHTPYWCLTNSWLWGHINIFALLTQLQHVSVLQGMISERMAQNLCRLVELLFELLLEALEPIANACAVNNGWHALSIFNWWCRHLPQLHPIGPVDSRPILIHLSWGGGRCGRWWTPCWKGVGSVVSRQAGWRPARN